MNDPVAIEPAGAISAFGVVMPDLPGCFSASDESRSGFIAQLAMTS